MELFDELTAWTLELRDPEFIHQHVVDAHMAQHATPATKPVGITMALVGLYLHAERGFTGRQVQLEHMRLGKRKREWPRFTLPDERGAMTEVDVMRAEDRKEAIRQWAKIVWQAFAINREAVIKLISESANKRISE